MSALAVSIHVLVKLNSTSLLILTFFFLQLLLMSEKDKVIMRVSDGHLRVRFGCVCIINLNASNFQDLHLLTKNVK